MDVHAGARRIAIWNKNKVVVAIAMCLWVVNGAFIIQGNSTPFPPSIVWNSCQSAFISRLAGTYAVVRVFGVPDSCILSTDSRSKECSYRPMHDAQRRGHKNGYNRFVCNGPRHTHHYARWPAPPWLPSREFFGIGTLHVETGGIGTIPACCAALKVPWRFFLRKGVIWLLIAMVVGVIPVVSPGIFRTSLLTFHNPISPVGP
jgi:hypothetical protein